MILAGFRLYAYIKLNCCLFTIAMRSVSSSIIRSVKSKQFEIKQPNLNLKYKTRSTLLESAHMRKKVNFSLLTIILFEYIVLVCVVYFIVFCLLLSIKHVAAGRAIQLLQIITIYKWRHAILPLDDRVRGPAEFPVKRILALFIICLVKVF